MQQANLLFYDGTCGFCHKSVQLVLKWSKDTTLLFATLQGEKAEEFKQIHPNFPKDLDHIVYHEQGQLYFGAEGFFKLAKHFEFPYIILSVFRFLPKKITQFTYSIIAQNRYKLFGKAASCALPPLKDRKRFIQ